MHLRIGWEKEMVKLQLNKATLVSENKVVFRTNRPFTSRFAHVKEKRERFNLVNERSIDAWNLMTFVFLPLSITFINDIDTKRL